MAKVRWGILATGRIAHRFAQGLAKSKTGVLQAIGSRDLGRAAEFAREHGAASFGFYEDVANHLDVDAVYIATPHHMHETHTVMCAQRGKAILCEKPFCLDLPSAERALAEVKKAGVYFCEAFMYRFTPQTAFVRQLLEQRVVGTVHHVRAEFGYASGRNLENFRFERTLGGGALMDVGVYPVSFARMVFGEEPEKAAYAFEPAGDGYDGCGTGLLQFSAGRTASFSCAVHVAMENQAVVYGSSGSITVESPWFCNGRVVVRRPGLPDAIHGPWEMSDLYAYEIDAVAAHLATKEAPEMTVEDTLGQAQVVGALKESGGHAIS